MSVIEVKNLTKQFPQSEGGKLVAVDDVSFSIEKGEVFGLLGPNGAGKTTTLEIIEGLLKPTSGSTIVLGLNSQHEPEKVKGKIGVQLQSSSFYDYLNLAEILKLFGGFYKKQVDADKLLEIVDLTEKKKALVNKLSGGQQQRFSIAVSLVNDPEVVFLDEPTTGLDPQARRHMWKFIQRINEQGKTVVLTTHYMEEAEELCHRVGIMDHGKIASLDSPRKLIDNLKATARMKFFLENPVAPETFTQIQGVTKARVKNGNEYRLRITHASEVIPPLMNWAKENNQYLRDIEISRATLEDVFIELTGSKLRD